MTIRQEERLRSILLVAALMLSVGKENKEIMRFLQENNIPESMINIFGGVSLVASCYGGNWFESKTVEYQQLLNLEKEVLKNAKKLFMLLEKTNPIESLALYSTLYRCGYLSVNHEFEFSVDSSMDFGKLYSLDVILGKAVCRSISDLYVKICNELGMKSKNVLIHVDNKTFKGIEKFPAFPIEVNEKENNVLGNLIAFLPLNNHVISLVEKEDAYYLDATNVTIFNKKMGNRLYIEGSEGHAYVCNMQEILSILTRKMEVSLLAPQSNISYKECLELYKKAFNDIQGNMDYLESFYLENQDLYQEIANIAQKQHSYLKRMFPILPIK